MNAKIKRVINEIEKTKGKISEFQGRLRDLEKQKTELENLEIISAVRGMDISLADLADMLKNSRPTSGNIRGHAESNDSVGKGAVTERADFGPSWPEADKQSAPRRGPKSDTENIQEDSEQ